MSALTFTLTDVTLWVGPARIALTRDLLGLSNVSDLGRDLAHETPGGTRLVGQVQEGQRRYAVTTDWDGETFEGTCTCPVHLDCTHAVAVALAALQGPPPAPPRPQPEPLPPRRGPTPAWAQLVNTFQASASAAKKGLSITLRFARGESIASLQGRIGTPTYVISVGSGEGAAFKPMVWSRLRVDARFDLQDRQRLLALRPLLFNEYALNSEQWYALSSTSLSAFLSLAAGFSRIEDDRGKSLHIAPNETVRSLLIYERGPNGALLVPTLVGPAGPLPGDDLDYFGDPPAWVLSQGVLRPLQAARDTLPCHAPLAHVEPADMAAFERRLPDLALQGRILGTDLPTTLPSISPGKPSAQLVLETDSGTLTGHLGFVYGGVRLEPDEPIVHVGPPEGPWHTRDTTLEHKVTKPLTAVLKRAGIGPYTFALKEDDALDFLQDELPRILKAGVEVHGQDRLGELRVHTDPARTRINVTSGIDWLDVEASLSVGEERVPWAAVWDALARGRRYVRLGSGASAKLPRAWLTAHRPFLAAIGADGPKPVDMARIAHWQAPAVAKLLDSADEAVADTAFTTFSRKLRNLKGIPDIPVPPGFEGELRPYQHAGLSYMAFLRDHGLHGILADDMGLGKTVQAAALLADNHRPGPKRKGAKHAPSLVVAPASLVENWRSELGRFAPALRVLVLHGPDRNPGAIAQADVVVTTYATARLDLAIHRAQTYHTVILDEAQAIKNPTSKTTEAMRALPARHRLCLTGTPIENDLAELWSLFTFLMPGMLGNITDFRARFSLPISNGDAEAATALKARTSPFILRRLKSEVATDLPPRTEVIVPVSFDAAQKQLYQAVLLAAKTHVEAEIAEKGAARSQLTILTAMLRLRQVCCHPALLGQPETARIPSAKLDAFMTLVDELVTGGHRALVFSQFTQMLALIRERLDAQGIAYEYLDGSTRDRQGRVTRFNAGTTPLFLISLKAGGTGLNLVGADYVIHFDPWWNPAVEDQATDRAHRIGQTRHVFSYKLIATGTIEEKLVTLQARKRALVRDVLDAEAFGKSLTAADLEFLFT